MKKIFMSLWNFKISVLLIVITVIANSWCNLSLPNYLSDIINIGIAQKDMDMIIRTGLIMLVFTLAAMISTILTGLFSAKVSMGLGQDLRSSIFKKVQNFSLEEFDKFSTSSLITRTSNDITQVQNFMMMFLRVIIMAPIMCTGGIIMAFNKNTSMSRVLFFSIPVLIFFVFLIANKAIPLSKKMQKKIDRINLVMREKLTGIRVMRAFVTEDHESQRFHESNNDLMQNSLKLQRSIAFMEPILMLVLNGTVISLLWVGGTYVSSGQILIGDIIAIIQYVMQIMMAVTMMSMIFVMYPRASASADRINEVIDTPPSIINIKNPKSRPNIHGRLEFRDVTFYFAGAKEPAIKNISFKANPGETTAIIGSTGSGKSSLVNLIPRLYDATSGEVLVDGINVKEYDFKSLRKKIGYIPQKALLFHGSVTENIRMGDEHADDSRVIEVAKIAQAYNFIMKKSEGFNFPISQGGANVSGGQRQRLAIARAIVRKPEIYIFDDSFSALDFSTEAALRTALAKETMHSTVIIVAQRVSTIMNADRIIVLDDGEMVGMGKHSELLRTCKVYQEIVHSQLSNEEAGA